MMVKESAYNQLKAEGHYFAIFLCECTVPSEKQTTYSEEFHLLAAGSLEEAKAKAQARADAQNHEYLNIFDEPVKNRVLEIVEVSELFFAPKDEALFVRSFTSRAGYDAYQKDLRDWEQEVMSQDNNAGAM